MSPKQWAPPTYYKSKNYIDFIAAIDEVFINEEFEESGEEEIPPRVLEESEEWARERRFGGVSSPATIETLKMQ